MANDDDKLYIMQNGFIGDSMCFWRKKGAGYTPNILEAELWTRDSALAQHRMREEDIPWLLTDLQPLIEEHISVYSVNKNNIKALEG